MLEEAVMSRTMPTSSVGSPLFMSWRSVQLELMKDGALDRTTGTLVIDVRVGLESVGTPDLTADVVPSFSSSYSGVL